MGHPLKQINEIAYSWASYMEKIQSDISSHLLNTEEGCILVDPVLPEEGGIESLLQVAKPEAIVLLNHHHVRDSLKFREELSIPILISEKARGLISFEPDRTFEDGEELPGGFKALSLGIPSPSETAIVGYHTLVIGDSLINVEASRGLSLLPVEFSPGLDHQELKKALQTLLVYFFEAILFGHGTAITEDALDKMVAVVA